MVPKNMKEKNKIFLEELTSVSDMIDHISEERGHDIESLQKKISGDKPVKRLNDPRLKRHVSEIESVIDQCAYKLEIIIEELDRAASKMSKADDNLPRVIELILKGSEALKIKYEVRCGQYLYDTVTYKIEKKHKNIAAKWKRKINSLVIVRLQKEDQEAALCKKDISLTKRKITNNAKNKDRYAEQNEKDIESKEQMIKQNADRKELLEKDNEIMAGQIQDNTDVMIENESEKRSLREEMTAANRELKGIYKAQASEEEVYNSDILQLNELLREKDNERHQLQLQEKMQREKAQKTIIFKKWKLKEADNTSYKIFKIENDIRNIDLKIKERNSRHVEACELTKNAVDSKNLIINTGKQRSSELTEQNNKLKMMSNMLRKKSQSNSEEIKELKKTNTELSLSVKRYRNKISKYETELSAAISRLVALESNYRSILERRDISQKQADEQKEKDKAILEKAYDESILYRIQERILNPDVLIDSDDEAQERIIDSSDLIVRASNYKCAAGHHRLLQVTAIIKVMSPDGISEAELPACYCEKCDKYYVLEKYYQKLKEHGYICCKVEKYDVSVSPSDNDKFSNYKDRSLLMTYGYTVNSNDNLSDDERQEILKFIISNKIMSKEEIISFLEWLISTKQNNPNNKFAIKKWERDIEFLNGISRRSISIMVNRLIVPVRRIKIAE